MVTAIGIKIVGLPIKTVLYSETLQLKIIFHVPFAFLLWPIVLYSAAHIVPT